MLNDYLPGSPILDRPGAARDVQSSGPRLCCCIDSPMRRSTLYRISINLLPVLRRASVNAMRAAIFEDGFAIKLRCFFQRRLHHDGPLWRLPAHPGSAVPRGGTRGVARRFLTHWRMVAQFLGPPAASSMGALAGVSAGTA